MDTSALIAVLIEEDGHEALYEALLHEPTILPAPTRLEFLSVARGARFDLDDRAEALLMRLERIVIKGIHNWDKF